VVVAPDEVEVHFGHGLTQEYTLDLSSLQQAMKLVLTLVRDGFQEALWKKANSIVASEATVQIDGRAQRMRTRQAASLGGADVQMISCPLAESEREKGRPIPTSESSPCDRGRGAASKAARRAVMALRLWGSASSAVGGYKLAKNPTQFLRHLRRRRGFDIPPARRRAPSR